MQTELSYTFEMKDFSPTLQFISGRIAEFRKEKNMTQAELADKLGKSRVYVVALESEESDAQPTVEILYRLSEIFDRPVTDFLPPRLLEETPPVFFGDEISEKTQNLILEMISEVRNGR